MYLDVQHSTDTTAIWSFVIAMVVAFILGISATIIAIWYGRKSFQLTEMSFKTVSEDIKQSAESHRDVNQRILDSQKADKHKEIILAFNQQWSDKLVDSASELNQNLDAWIFLVMGFSDQTIKVKKDQLNFRLSEDKYFMNDVKLIHSNSENINKLLNKLVIYVSLFNGENEYNELLFLLNSLKIEIKQVKAKSLKFKALDEDMENIFQKNIMIFSEINNLLQNEKMKIIKAA